MLNLENKTYITKQKQTHGYREQAGGVRGDGGGRSVGEIGGGGLRHRLPVMK